MGDQNISLQSKKVIKHTPFKFLIPFNEEGLKGEGDKGNFLFQLDHKYTVHYENPLPSQLILFPAFYGQRFRGQNK